MRARKRISRERSAREQGEAAARASDRTIFILTYSTLTYAAAPPACLARRALRLSPLARARGVDRPPHRSNARATAPHALVSRARVGPRESGREGRKREREKGGKKCARTPATRVAPRGVARSGTGEPRILRAARGARARSRSPGESSRGDDDAPCASVSARRALRTRYATRHPHRERHPASH